MRSVSVLLLLCMLYASSLAHVRNVFPQPRSFESGLKEPKPCGGIGAQNFRSVFVIGSNITVSWQETIYHPGYYNVSLNPKDETVDGFASIGSHVFPHTSPPANPTYLYELALPKTDCQVKTTYNSNRCILQVLMYMSEKNSNYYSCSDIQLVSKSEYDDLHRTCPANCANEVFCYGSNKCVCDYWINGGRGCN